VPPREQEPTSSEPSSEPSVADDQGPDDRAAYLAFVAHEMRNPLSTALWSAELLTRMAPQERGGPRGEKLAGMCLRTLVRLRHLVEDYFLSERLEIRGLPVRTEPVQVADALGVAASRAGVQPAETVIDGAMVVADRAMLERALEALLAVAARDGSPVHVTADSTAGATTVAVRGAEPGDHPFRKPDRSTLSDPSGRALALLAARAVAEAHGGSLETTADGYRLSLPSEDGAGGPGGEPR
jgi:K+-sensing histidine kinase KdpD